MIYGGTFATRKLIGMMQKSIFIDLLIVTNGEIIRHDDIALFLV
jgi:hypothetical protein